VLQSAELLIDTEPARRSLMAKAARLVRSLINLSRKLVAPITKRIERNRVHAEIGAMGAHLRNDVGLDPLDTFYGWRGSPRRED
jgi:hypothetical protein